MEAKANTEKEKLRVAKTAIFILFCVFLERYSTGGIASVLFMFFNEKIGYDEDESTAAYHTYEFLSYFFPIVGAVIADSLFGRLRTIVCMCIIIAIGSLITAIGVVDTLNLPINIIGLVILTFGDGCLITLFPTYGAEQYRSTEIKSIDWFFASYYFMFNCGSIASRLVAPILREDVKCFRNDDCYPVIFGLPAILMVAAALLVMVGNRYSETKQVRGHTILNVLSCMTYAVVKKFSSRKTTQYQHWLDYSKDKYGNELVSDTRIILKVIVLYIPITVFWALFYQQGSRWVYQATQMNGDLGFYTIKADQFNVANPLFVIILIPLFEHVLYPLLAKVRIRTALQKTTLGGVLGGISFLISAIIQLQIESKFLHMTWLIPQYLFMAMGEILVAISLINFSFSEAPDSMKTLLQAMFYLSAGIGNLIVVVVAGSRIFDSQFYEFILYTGLMFFDMILFALLAKRYKSEKVQRCDEIIENS
ncbi:solute carrier family 15 member 1-like [Bradysia coprophila]|uniref:solute carrier family 15 member 1-like n=1 Tax=Bradysia coprophila TaxID=38358 RepID=UPI00187D7903|nr:solute carrier family 15 member 1-like [Bradysia coprophila]